MANHAIKLMGNVFAGTTSLGFVAGGLGGGMAWTDEFIKKPKLDTAVSNLYMIPTGMFLGGFFGAALPVIVASTPFVGVSVLLAKKEDSKD